MPFLPDEYGKRSGPAFCINLKMGCAFILLPSCHDTNAEQKKCLLFPSLSTLCSNYHCKSNLLSPWSSCIQPEIVLSSASFTASICPDWNQMLHPVMRLPDVLSLAKVKKCTSSYPILQRSGKHAVKCVNRKFWGARCILKTIFLWTSHVLCEVHGAQRGLISQNTYLEIDIHSVQEDTTEPAVKIVLKNITVVICYKFALW